MQVHDMHTTVYGLFRQRALHHPNADALIQGDHIRSYADTLAEVDAIAAGLAYLGVGHGDRVSILSENRPEFLMVILACAKIGAIAACQNWRLSPTELEYCIGLVDPKLVICSGRYGEIGRSLATTARQYVAIDGLGRDGNVEPAAQIEDLLLIMYTSGTTGLPKAAAISHRAEIARMCVHRMDLDVTHGDAFVAWPPMCHMAGTDHSLAMLMSGNPVIVTDGLDLEAIGSAIRDYPLGFLALVPGMIDQLLDNVKRRGIRPRSVRSIGTMADLVPANTLVEVTEYFQAPYMNSFGSTESGLGPLSGNKVAIGTAPARLPKTLTSLSELRLIDDDWNDAATGQIGEACARGPMSFSGYWANPDATAAVFRDGWFRMGDLFQPEDDGFIFVGRSKYLIKSGGENIYPAEIERLLLADKRVEEATVVRRPDEKWGEVPVAFVARNDPSMDEAEIERICRASLAGYKRPRDVRFIEVDAFPRNATGKILREELERSLLS